MRLAFAKKYQLDSGLMKLKFVCMGQMEDGHGKDQVKDLNQNISNRP